MLAGNGSLSKERARPRTTPASGRGSSARSGSLAIPDASSEVTVRSSKPAALNVSSAGPIGTLENW